ncbi:Protein of unknown function [Gryllus bimaculatus]|nr:Protein of unknown function [Gryllus bimaculatus]
MGFQWGSMLAYAEMECESLIDFNSPLKKGSNMLDPLVPLPQANNVQENIGASTVGDNPFDNVILQICKLDDPFEITEKKALERNKNKQVSQNKMVDQKESNKKEPNIQKEETNNRLKSGSKSKCGSPQCKLSSSYDASNLKVSSTPEKKQNKSLNEKSLSESCLSPTIGKLDRKFSKLYLSAQLDKQLLDESSRCMLSADEDTSLLNVSKIERSCDKSLRSPMNFPKGKEEVKAFVANRIEKCIEKALNDSRRSVNSSFHHRRSLSATSLYTGSALHPENPYNYSFLRPTLEPSSAASMYRNRSFSNHDLHSSFNTKMWGSQHNILDGYSGEMLSNTASRFNTGFRKSTATSSMYSSYGIGDIGFRRSMTSLSSYRPSNTSIANISCQGNGDESVFVKDDLVVMGGKSSTCVFMEAKNLSSIIQRRATAEDDEPLEADINFLTDDNFQIELVDSDSSCSEFDDDEGNSEQRKPKQNSEKGLKVEGSSPSNIEDIPSGSNVHPPLSCEKIAVMGLQLSSQTRKPRGPLLVPPPPVPLAPASNNRNLVLKPKSQAESKVGKRGPMKAMIPVGNMMRQEARKENVPSKQVIGRVPKGDLKLIPNNLRKSESARDKLQKDNSTPDGVLPLVSPAVGLQVSHIAKDTPVDPARKRSKSAGTTASAGPETESHLTTTPARKPTRHVRSKSGLANSELTRNSFGKNKTQSPDPISPGQMPVCTSTPLKSLTKNSPSLNRAKKPSPVRKLLQKDNTHMEKENRQPRLMEQKQRLSWRSRSSTRRTEVN